MEKILKLIKNRISKYFLFLGITTWPTKNYEVLLNFQYILYIAKPKNILELGSGLSSFFLSVYAQKAGCNFVSVEQNMFYLLKFRRGLSLFMLSKFNIHYVPLNKNWFDIRRLNKICGINYFDFILIDAPGGSLNKGSRDSNQGNSFLNKFINNKVIIWDDYHREEVRNSVKSIFKENQIERFNYIISYEVGRNQNLILFSINKELKANVLGFLLLSKIWFKEINLT